MTAKVGAASAVEPRTVEMSGTTMTPASSAGTKWGPDLTQDASVKKGRALAYQVPLLSDITACLLVQILSRLGWIKLHNWLKSGMLEDENDEDLLSAPQDLHHKSKSSKHEIDAKETGAKIQVYGTKAGTGHKGSLAAVSNIGASVSGDNAHVPSQVQDSTTSNMVPTTVVNHGMVQPLPGLGTNFTGWAVSVPCRLLFALDKIHQQHNFCRIHIWLPSLHQFKLMFQLHSHSWETDHCLLRALLDGQAGPPAPQPGVASMPPPSNISTANMVSSLNHPIAAPSFISFRRPQAGLPSTSLQARIPSSVSGSVPNFATLKPPMMTAQSPGDFTFQPHRPQNPSFQAMPNLPGHLPPRPGNYIQIQQNYPAHATRAEIPRAPNQQFSNNLAFSSGKSASGPGGGQQLYDPFSPTSANQQQGGNPGKM
uniref:T3.2 protein n=1 Tax=Malus x robusta TaxID=1184610 RepID=I7J3J3_9ROSA|nr:T3.2 [Malus x robusta]